MSVLKKIDIHNIEGYHIGNKEIPDAGTGSTVILCDGKTTGAVDIRGGAPASREAGLLNPLAANDAVNAVLLSGGSAYGLDAASGIMQYLEEKGKGFDVGDGVVPIVCASCIFDLGFNKFHVRPDKQFGYDLCKNAEENNYKDGNYGCGCGATAGKVMGPAHMMKTGIGSAAYQLGDIQIGAVVAVNCVGDVYDIHTGKKIAGVIDYDTKQFIDAEEIMYAGQLKAQEHTNTTIGCIITNCDFNKTELTKIAGMAHDGMARAIRPVHTMFDGDSLYALGNHKVKCDINAAGTLAARVVAEAVANAAYNADTSCGVLANKDL